MRKNKGFTLAEMMVVLLIMSIIMAAAAPIISKKATTSVSKATSSSVPAGTIMNWAGTKEPSGRWLRCDGTAYSPTDKNGIYKDLFKAIGYQYGQNGSKFLVPDLAGRIAVGQDPNSERIKNAKYLNNFGGEELHTMTRQELPTETLKVTAKLNFDSNADLNTTTTFDSGNPISAYAPSSSATITGTTGTGVTTGQSSSTTPTSTSDLYVITTNSANAAPNILVGPGYGYCAHKNSYGGCEEWDTKGYSIQAIDTATLAAVAAASSTTNIVNTHYHPFSFRLPALALLGTVPGTANGSFSSPAKFSTDNLGSGQPFTNMAPYLVLNYYIKY